MRPDEAVDHEPAPLRIIGGFGTGKTSTLAARAQRLRDAGRSVVLLERPGDAVAFASGLLRRHGRAHEVVDEAEQRSIVRTLLQAGDVEWGDIAGDSSDHSFADEVAVTVLRFQSSFLGAEELFVHADAAGELPRWEALARFATRYLDELNRLGVVDTAGAIVEASMLLRDPQVLAAERAVVDDVLVDDFQLVDFATNRFLTQLVGRSGSYTVAGNPDAALGSERGWSASFLRNFCRRFDAESVDLGDRSFRAASPIVRVVDTHEDREALLDSLVTAEHEGRRITHEEVVHCVGQEWPVVVVEDASADVWPSPRPAHRWFDPHLFGGPDVPSDAERDAAWVDEERRRFAIACTRASQQTVVVATRPVTPFVRDLPI